MSSYYRGNYLRCLEAERLAIAEGDFTRAGAERAAAIRWLEMEQRWWDGEPEDEETEAEQPEPYPPMKPEDWEAIQPRPLDC